MRRSSASSELAALPVVLAILLVGALTVRDAYWMGVLTTLAVSAVAVLGLDLVFGWAGQLSLAAGPLFVLGGYSQAIFTTTYGWSAAPAVVATTALILVVSVALAGMALRVKGFVYAILTVFVALLLPAFLIAFPKVTGGGDGLPVGTLRIGRLTIATPLQLFLAALVVLAAAYTVHMLLLCGKWGMRWRSLASSEVAYEATGNSARYALVMAFVAAGLFVGIAGALSAYYTAFMSPETASLRFAVAVLLAAILGGLGSYVGPLLGTLIVFGLPFELSTAGNLQDAIYAAAVLAVIAVLPEGLASLGRMARDIAGRRIRRDDRPLAAPKLERLNRRLSRRSSADRPGALAVKALHKTYAGVTALDDCTMAIRPGGIVGIVGPNGSGKSTLLNAISGIVTLESGAVCLGDRDITTMAVNRRARLGIARTFQVPALPARLRVWQVIALACARSGGSIRTAKARSVDILEELGLGALAERTVRDLPHPQHRLIALAQALAESPDFLLLDEPVAGISEADADALAEILRAVAATGIGVGVVEHHLDWVGALADEVVVLQAGAVIARGAPHEVAATVDEVVRGLGGARTAVSPAATDEPRAASGTALEATGISAGYGGVAVLRDVTIAVPEHGVAGLIGPNGAGKTTLLHALAGLLPSTGSVSIGDEAINRLSADGRTRRGLVLAGEGRPLFRQMSVRENLELALVVERLGRTARNDRLDHVLERFEVLGRRMTTPAGNLSGGQQQMLLLACCFAKQPRVLLIDEPTLGLAESVAEEVWSTLLRLCRDDAGLSVLIADEEAERITRVASVVYAIERGRVQRWSPQRGDRSVPVAQPGGK